MDEHTVINETAINEASISETEFNEIFAIMEASFPVSEIRTRSGQQALLDHPNYHLYSSKDTEGHILAFWRHGSYLNCGSSSILP
ncbi:hypothetical protein ACFSQ7_45720 [Paenibacillus rhizoplanae]